MTEVEELQVELDFLKDEVAALTFAFFALVDARLDQPLLLKVGATDQVISCLNITQELLDRCKQYGWTPSNAQILGLKL